MKKYIIQTTLISTTIVILSWLFSASSFADTTATGTTSTGTTSTGTTSTGATSTGTTSTGTTSTGTTSTGTTSTGVYCGTASGVKVELAAIQQAFLVEMTRLINEKWAAYTSAMSLSGSLKTDAIKAANEKFRIWVQNAIKTRESAKQNKSNYQCKEPKKEDYSNRNLEKHNGKYDDKKHNDRNDDKKEIKNQIKDLKKDVKKYIKKYSSNKRDRR